MLSTQPDRAVEKAREAALRLLDRSRKTRHELEKKLIEREHGPEAVAQALDRLARVGVVDDVEYAKAFVRSKLARRAVALRVVRQELRRRGVSEPDVEQALAQLDAESTVDEAQRGDANAPLRRLGGAGERARAAHALAPLWRRYRALEPRERRTRCASALARRGFDYGTVSDVLDAALVAETAGPVDPGALPD
jgi:regulatory protein